MPDPEILPDPDGQPPTQPSELPAGGRPGLDIPELPDEGDPLENDVEIGPGGLEIGPR
ncbi:MAG: hypothetical protein Q8L59_09570 [Phenylobacterium sp.]|uniref:hypothetical protein n=1 Tax=Phenylobacterium sp. TaxID=1871053 RepID=UPI0027360FC1|nr:hypothetical protein [Phenylobacterium sp.]MDP1642419.1 hypothetical protein [Phenylobacterium sp.]MDP3117437.1 hypothetical protein [Phenylobacterium sp.]